MMALANGNVLSGTFDLSNTATTQRWLIMTLDQAKAVEQVVAVKDLKHQSIASRNSIFDLQGRKVTSPKKGLYVINGKKVVR